jgi:hypothetical protein
MTLIHVLGAGVARARAARAACVPSITKERE